MKAFECPNCGATLDPSQESKFITCAYCGTTVHNELYQEPEEDEVYFIRAACDFLYNRQNAPPILWLCDRAEFEPEVQRMGVSFLHTGTPPYHEKDTILKAIGELLAKASTSEEYRRSEVVQ